MKDEQGIWGGEMFAGLVGDLALFFYRLRSRFPAIALVPEEYPNDYNRSLPGQCAYLLVQLAHEPPVDPKKVREKEHVLFNLIVAGVIKANSGIDKLSDWQREYKENQAKIRDATRVALQGRKFHLEMSQREVREMRESISEYGIELFLRDFRQQGIGLKVCVEGDVIRGLDGYGSASDVRFPWVRLFPEGTPERVYLDKISFWNDFWNSRLANMVNHGVVLDPQATWKSCQRQIRHCRKIIESVVSLGEKYGDG